MPSTSTSESKKKKPKKEKKHKSIEVEIDGDGQGDDDIDINVGDLIKHIDVAVGHELKGALGQMMHDEMGQSYMNEVTPLYYYPQNGAMPMRAYG